MYLSFNQVHFIDQQLATHRGVTESDTVPVFERELRGERILTTSDEQSKFAGDAKLYGKLYWSNQDEPCVIPVTWNWDDTYSVKSHDHISYYQP